MILVDASVLIDVLRSRDPELQRTLVDSEAAICGVTLAEVLHGARSDKDFDRLVASLSKFPQVGIPDDLWIDVGRHLSKLRRAGVTVPFSDAVVATVAIANDLELWATDAHFPLIQNVLPQLKLFKPI
jgi:predicted nucleic acid-binding protein